MSSIRIRPAIAADYRAFVELVPQLIPDDPIPDERRFVSEMLSTTMIAEGSSGAVVGYLYFQILGSVAYVRHLVTDRAWRRKGAGRALLEAVAGHTRARDCTCFCLNVQPSNTAAVSLYESVGLARVHESKAMRIDWALVLSQPRLANVTLRHRRIEPGDDATVEQAMNWVPGQLADARAFSDRVLVMLEENGSTLVGAAIFHPHFPGASPFHVTRPELACVLLRDLRRYARPEDTFVNIVVEGQPAVANELLKVGADVRLELVHMMGSLRRSAS